jgi:hypothetical protein
MPPLPFVAFLGYLGAFHIGTGLCYLLFHIKPLTPLEIVSGGLFMVLFAGVLTLCQAGYRWYRQRRQAPHACL